MPLNSGGYAVFDIETTGLALHSESIVEIAVVHVDVHGSITGSWDTLLKPSGGVGPTGIHGITQSMVQDAPRFAEVADHLYELFAGRVAVAHNLPGFDGRFLTAHFGEVGIDAPAIKGGVCTLKYARRVLPGTTHRLEVCCDLLGIELSDAHQALADTVATAQLLGRFISRGVALEGSVVPARYQPPLTVPGPRLPIDQVFRPRSGVVNPGQAVTVELYPHQSADL
ncbi:MAG TPA: 3'-5' exonuclease [Actinocrinis sp.]|nr:3'-5' exonuclease [Actinocrinis sp.]